MTQQPINPDFTDLTRNNETEILRRTVEALLAMPGATGLHVAYDGFVECALHDSSDFEAIREACLAVDDCRLYLTRGGHKTQWVYFIWANGNYGLDAITDYSIGLKDALKPVFDWIEQQESAA